MKVSSAPAATTAGAFSQIQVTSFGGLAKQFRVVAMLPSPCQQIAYSSGVRERSQESKRLEAKAHRRQEYDDEGLCEVTLLGTEKKMTPPAKGGVRWRRRESNPRPVAL
jgi:hypothetical protein